MKTEFKYSVLKYKHSQFLGEELNVGLLFFFPTLKEVDFLYPSSLQRISKLYRDFSVYTLKKYLKSFDIVSSELTKIWNEQSTFFNVPDDEKLAKIISENFLVNDSTTLRFSDIKSGKYDNIKELKSYYYNKIFSHYDYAKPVKHKDEQYIKKKINSLIREYSLPENVFRKNIVLHSNYFDIEFDLGWVNGTTNLITPISFDLSNEDYIVNKAHRWHGKLETLSEVRDLDKYRFDLFVSRPKDNSLTDKYRKAIELLHRNPAPKNIIEEGEYNKYLKKVKSELNHR